MVLFIPPVPKKNMIIFLFVNIIWRTILIVTFVFSFHKAIIIPTIAFVTDFMDATFVFIGRKKILNFASQNHQYPLK